MKRTLEWYVSIVAGTEFAEKLTDQEIRQIAGMIFDAYSVGHMKGKSGEEF